MKKRYIPIALYLVLTVTNTFAQSSFTNTIGENWEDEEGYAMYQNSDGTIVIAGFTESISSGWRDAFLVKTTSSGDTLWTKKFGLMGYDEFTDVVKTSDGGYAMVGRTWDTGTFDNEDVYLVKTDANGNLEWQNIYGGSEDEIGYALKQTQDGGYIITGSVSVLGGAHILLIKTDAGGVSSWTKTFQASSYGEGEAVIETSTGDFMVFGYRSNTMYLMKTNANGDSIWSQEYPDGEYGMDMKETSDGGYILLGFTNAIGAGDYDMYLVKVDANGVSQWAQTYGGADYENAEAVIQSSDGGYVLVGSSFTYATGENDLYIVKTNGTGDLEWQKNYGSVYYDVGYDVVQASDGGFVVAGYYTQAATFYSDVYLLKDMGGPTSIETNSAQYSELISVAPNPFKEKTTLTIRVDSRDAGNMVYLDLFDALGRTISNIELFAETPGFVNIVIEREKLPQGLYFYKIRSNEEVIATGKLTAQ